VLGYDSVTSINDNVIDGGVNFDKAEETIEDVADRIIDRTLPFTKHLMTSLQQRRKMKLEKIRISEKLLSRIHTISNESFNALFCSFFGL